MRRITTLVVLVSAGIAAPGAHAQFRQGHAPGDLGEYDWTAWLVGEWEGVLEMPGQSIPFRQQFRLTPDRQYLLTHNERGTGASAYRGTGVFSYYPVTDDAFGSWFGSEHDTNLGWAVRDGDSMVWTIHRLGQRITRTRTRTGPDSYVVDNVVMQPDGSVTRSRETMRRVPHR